jgi:thiol-disulfide isomerase/thioredoxin
MSYEEGATETSLEIRNEFPSLFFVAFHVHRSKVYPAFFSCADYYATWCHACQRVYPTLCLIAEDPKLRKQIVFAKVCVPLSQ